MFIVIIALLFFICICYCQELSDPFPAKFDPSNPSKYDNFQMSEVISSTPVPVATGSNTYGQRGYTQTDYIPKKISILDNVQIVDIAVGFLFTLFLDSNGVVYGIGSNIHGQLGIESESITNYSPIRADIGQLTNKIVKIYAGNQFSILLDRIGNAYSFGRNNYGQLGHGTTIQKTTPTKITGILNGKMIKYLSTGHFHTILMDTNNTLYGFGHNGLGQLGNGLAINQASPVHVNTTGILKNKIIIDISAGWVHTLVLDNNGIVYGFGDNSKWQLGDSISSPILPVKLNVLGKIITKISAGKHHSMFLDSDGIAYGFGKNYYGQLGDGTKQDRMTMTRINLDNTHLIDISTTNEYTMVLDGSGAVYSFGDDTLGQLGQKLNTKTEIPTKIDTTGTINVKYGKIVKSMYTGYSHTFFLADTSNISKGSHISGIKISFIILILTIIII